MTRNLGPDENSINRWDIQNILVISGMPRLDKGQNRTKKCFDCICGGNVYVHALKLATDFQ